MLNEHANTQKYVLLQTKWFHTELKQKLTDIGWTVTKQEYNKENNTRKKKNK